ncbi:zeta toxin family protein [Pseudomonas viridiflava]|uniref:zeta toxin family protein n=1 Tax=Pseudomonas viridiflava TaxID=33069 RepID=UPI000F01E2FE
MLVEFTDDEKRLWNETIKFARQNKKAIGRKLTSLDLYPAEDQPVSVFMSGSPGAGKTEASIALLNLFTSSSILRIDPDELRAEFDLYTGGNAYLFQGGISILISKIIDLALSQQQSFLLDGTLAKIDIARSNVERSLEKGRYVQVLYVYQNPLLAWEFVKAREQAGGRRILADHFVEQYFSARDVVNTLKLEYGKHVHVDLLLKHIDNSARLYKAGMDRIDYHIPERYTRDELAAALENVSPQEPVNEASKSALREGQESFRGIHSQREVR